MLPILRKFLHLIVFVAIVWVIVSFLVLPAGGEFRQGDWILVYGFVTLISLAGYEGLLWILRPSRGSPRPSAVRVWTTSVLIAVLLTAAISILNPLVR